MADTEDPLQRRLAELERYQDETFKRHTEMNNELREVYKERDELKAKVARLEKKILYGESDD